ncbi:hypothetical protein [Vibrio parahaemolyticus]|uniref:hypothetical protein n=1 Tax=Vibrio parahaemolyticus TaxID=670 RepID=UPI0011203191|nr:hypothetical protein [Vibrio parahaemolyticus]TNY77514.1 hypothetical protein CGK62_08190 [Vibrio parahaemolyticus]
MKVKDLVASIRRDTYKNYVMFFKGFVVTFGVFIAGWGQTFPYIDGKKLAAKEAEYYLEQEYGVQFADIDCAVKPKLMKDCKMAIFKVQDHRNVSRIYLVFFVIIFTLSFLLLFVSLDGNLQSHRHKG